MPSGGSMTHWIWEVRQGDSAAAKAFWQCYYSQLVHLAQTKLQSSPRQMTDKEDVVLNTMNRFYQAS
jgi:hypothetical protein